jgi:hypothetical protein
MDGNMFLQLAEIVDKYVCPKETLVDADGADDPLVGIVIHGVG